MERPHSDARIVSTDTDLSGASEGALAVRDGATLVLSGSHVGSIQLEAATLILSGSLQGHLDVGSLSTATVTGDLQGSVEIRVAGTLIVQPDGRIVGPVDNFGSYTNHGLRAGRVEGRTPDDQPGSTDVPPTHPGGTRYDVPARVPLVE